MADQPADDPVTVTARELAAHKQDCATCHAERIRAGAPLCSRRIELAAAWRQALREAAPKPAEPDQSWLYE